MCLGGVQLCAECGGTAKVTRRALLHACMARAGLGAALAAAGELAALGKPGTFARAWNLLDADRELVAPRRDQPPARRRVGRFARTPADGGRHHSDMGGATPCPRTSVPQGTLRVGTIGIEYTSEADRDESGVSSKRN